MWRAAFNAMADQLSLAGAANSRLKFKGGKKMDQLSSIDASFLHLETPETPMHVGSLMLFELPEGCKGDYYEDVKAMLGRRLHLSALLNRKLAQMHP